MHFAAQQTERALAKAREATTLLRSIQERHPATRKHARDAAFALSTFGHQLAKAGVWTDASATWSVAGELLEKLAGLGGLNPDQEVSLAIIHRYLAEAALGSAPADIPAARSYLGKGLNRLRGLQTGGKLPADALSFIQAWEQRDRDLAEP